jgi:hypothetical protein
MNSGNEMTGIVNAAGLNSLSDQQLRDLFAYLQALNLWLAILQRYTTGPTIHAFVFRRKIRARQEPRPPYEFV